MSVWERLSARDGGTVTSLALAHHADGSTVVFAGTPVGVFCSTDGGQRWSPLGAASTVAGVEVVATSSRFQQDGVLFVGARDGLFRWRAGSPGWEHLVSGSRVLSVACRPDLEDGQTLLVGTEDDGILISRDDGRRWNGANPGLLDLMILALAISPALAEDGLAFAATPSGLYRTRNGAESWRAVRLDWEDVAVQCLALSPGFAEDRIVLAGTEEHGLLRSGDAGRSWATVPALAERSVNSLVFEEDGRVLAGTDQGLALSEDGGQTWRIAGEELGAVMGVCVVPDGVDAVLLAGLPAEGVARSADRGISWEAGNEGLATSLAVGLSLSPAFVSDQTLYLADSGTGIHVSQDGGQTWTTWNDGLDGVTVYQVASVPEAGGGQRVFAATEAGLYVRTAGDGAWRAALEGQAIEAMGVAGPHPPAPSPASRRGGVDVLVGVAGGEIMASGDRGESWQSCGRPFGFDPSRPGRVLTLALSPSFAADRTVYAATTMQGASDVTGLAQASEIVVWRSTDGGRRWEPWLEERGTPPVLVVALPPNLHGDSVLVGIGGRVLRPRPNAREVRGGVRRPLWQATVLPGQPSGGAPAITDLAASPGYAQDRTIFAATSAGVLVSRDGGASFVGWSDGLEPPAIVALVLSPTYDEDRGVYALGLGGTLWHRRDE